MELDQFTDLLATRVRARYDVRGGVFYLDLRAQPLGNRPPLVIRDRAAVGWPTKGQPIPAPPVRETKAYQTALTAVKAYVKRQYAPHLHALLYGGRAEVPGRGPTVAEACESYLAKAAKRLHAKNNTPRNRGSMLNKHVVPTFGARALATLTAVEVEAHLKDLMASRKTRSGRMKQWPAARATKRHVHQALIAVWRHEFPRSECPFERVDFDDGSQIRRLREAIWAGREEDLVLEEATALTPEQAERALVAAAAHDRKLATDPRWRHISVPNTAALIAFQIGTGARIGELALLRWWMIYESFGLMLIPGTKTRTSLRLIPIQDVLRPWIAAVKKLARPDGGSPDREDFVFPTNRRRPGEHPNKRNLQEKVALALELAGLKVPMERMDGTMTHWARSTHISWGSMETQRIAPAWLMIYAGHALKGLGDQGAVAFGAITRGYMSQRAAEVPEGHRTYIRHLPGPEDIREALKEFTPSPVRSWRERCRVRKPKVPGDR